MAERLTREQYEEYLDTKGFDALLDEYPHMKDLIGGDPELKAYLEGNQSQGRMLVNAPPLAKKFTTGFDAPKDRMAALQQANKVAERWGDGLGALTVGAKLAKLSLPIMMVMWNRAKGHWGYERVNPLLEKVGQQLSNLDKFVEDKIPPYKRAKELLKKAPLTSAEEEIVKSAPKLLRKLPKMERAIILAHYAAKTFFKSMGYKPAAGDDKQDIEQAAVASKGPDQKTGAEPKPMFTPPAQLGRTAVGSLGDEFVVCGPASGSMDCRSRPASAVAPGMKYTI